MRIAVTGASGLIGSALVPALRADGHEVLRLVRREARAADEVPWDPRRGTLDPAALAGVDAAVNLSGAGVSDKRWTPAYRREIRESRVRSTATLATALAALSPIPRVLLSASGISAYGDTGDREVDESAPLVAGFLPETVQAWEAATAPAEAAGVRVVHLRSAPVVAATGGAWGRRLFPIFRLGVGGRLGSGRQYWSFISLADHVRALRFLLTAESVRGPVNLAAPHPVTNAALTAAMGRVLRRPTPFPVPAPVVRLVVGGFAAEVLESRRVVPRKLLEAGFEFRHPDIDSALRAAWEVRTGA